MNNENNPILVINVEIDYCASIPRFISRVCARVMCVDLCVWVCLCAFPISSNKFNRNRIVKKYGSLRNIPRGHEMRFENHHGL